MCNTEIIVQYTAQSLPVNVPVMASVTNYDDGLHITEDSGIASSGNLLHQH